MNRDLSSYPTKYKELPFKMCLLAQLVGLQSWNVSYFYGMFFCSFPFHMLGLSVGLWYSTCYSVSLVGENCCCLPKHFSFPDGCIAEASMTMN